jgi:hypothetical protein
MVQRQLVLEKATKKEEFKIRKERVFDQYVSTRKVHHKVKCWILFIFLSRIFRKAFSNTHELSKIRVRGRALVFLARRITVLTKLKYKFSGTLGIDSLLHQKIRHHFSIVTFLMSRSLVTKRGGLRLDAFRILRVTFEVFHWNIQIADFIKKIKNFNKQINYTLGRLKQNLSHRRDRIN